MTKPFSLKENKKALVKAIQDLLQNTKISTQEEISKALKRLGYEVNQVKISRILNKIGAIKMNEGHKTVYRLPTELVTVKPTDSLKYLIMKITYNESLIIIQTTPGSAQLVARLLDQKKQSGILGTVAGDDTIFVAPESVKSIKKVFEQIQNELLV